MEHQFYKGQLKSWKEDKGFGFICGEHNKKDIFIHISALKNRIRRPKVGDIIFYQIHIDNDGKSRAVNAKIEGVKVLKPYVRRIPKKIQKKSNRFGSIFMIFLMLSSFVFYNTLIKDFYVLKHGWLESIYPSNTNKTPLINTFEKNIAVKVKSIVQICHLVPKPNFISVIVQELKWMVMEMVFPVKDNGVDGNNF